MYPKIIKKGTQNPPKWSPGGYPNTLSYIGPLYLPFLVDFGYPLGVTFDTVFVTLGVPFSSYFWVPYKTRFLLPEGTRIGAFWKSFLGSFQDRMKVDF